MAELKKLQVTEYRELGKLPDPFVFQDGTPVRTREDWRRRRQELIATAVALQYGTMPPQPEFVEVEPLNRSGPGPVSYTHLDVYKRQLPHSGRPRPRARCCSRAGTGRRCAWRMARWGGW